MENKYSNPTESLDQQQEVRNASVKQQVIHTLFEESGVQNICQQVTSDSITVESVFSAISDNKSLSLFNTIAIMSRPASDAGQPAGEILISRLNMTHRQYYTRIHPLVDTGLITKKRTRFNLTSLGRVVYETQKTIGVAIQNRWKLEAIDSIQISQLAARMPTEERQKLVNTLVGDCDKGYESTSVPL